MAAGDRFAGQLATSEAAMVEALAAALHGAGEIVQKEAQISITTGAISGKGHVPSKPGEPPKNDSGTLANHIEVVQPEPLRVEINSNAPYAAALEYGAERSGRMRMNSEPGGPFPAHVEFGGLRLAPRPYMQPAADLARPEIEKALGNAVTIAVRKHFGK